MTFESFCGQIAEDEFRQAKATKTYTITADPEFFQRFETFLAYVQWCALKDHVADVGFHINGPQETLLVHGLALWKRNVLRPLPARVETP